LAVALGKLGIRLSSKTRLPSGFRVADEHDGTGLEFAGSDAGDLLDAGFIMPTSLRDAIPKPPMQPRILVLSASAGLYSENNY
jgi:hypothetical protein